MCITRFRNIAKNTTLLASFAIIGAGCAAVDDVMPRTAVMNTSMANYNNYSTLLNIVRASQHEPLLFVAVTQGSPNLSLGATLAAPGFTFNPYHLISSTISGNSATATVSDSMQVQPLDDPGAWQAMLTPVDAATIGFFIKQGYSRELLFWLFIDHLRVQTGPNTWLEYTNDPTNPDDVQQFAGPLATLIQKGLTIEVERGAPKSGQTPTSRICFEVAEVKRVSRFFQNIQPAPGQPSGQIPVTVGPSQDKCSKEWLQGQATETASSQGKSTGTAAKTSPSQKPKQPEVWYSLPEINGQKWQFTTRSPYAIYQIMGRWLDSYQKGQIKGITLVTAEGDNILVHIETNRTAGCFVSLAYNGQGYCVPEDANLTKTAFSILHQVTGLNIVHAQTPGTLSVRAVP